MLQNIGKRDHFASARIQSIADHLIIRIISRSNVTQRTIFFRLFHMKFQQIESVINRKVFSCIFKIERDVYKRQRPLSKSQIVCIILLWVALCYIVLVYAERIDGPTILMLIISAALVFIPVYKSLKKNK